MRVVLGTGSREWKSFAIATRALQRAQARPCDAECHLRTGGARGADTVLDMVAHRLGWECSSYDAHWQDWCPGCRAYPSHRAPAQGNKPGHCPEAGFRRNAQMVTLGADTGVALFQAGERNKGTIDCAIRMLSAGIPVTCWCSCGRHGPAPCGLHQVRGVVQEWNQRLPRDAAEAKTRTGQGVVSRPLCL